MNRLVYTLCALVALACAACGPNEQERRAIVQQQKREAARIDSAAFKVAVVPTMDCLPLFIGVEDSAFQRGGVDVRLRQRMEQIDCDTLIMGRHVEGVVSDLVRTEWMKRHGCDLRYMAATNAYWLLMAGRSARIKETGQLSEKMIAMTRHSATAMLSDLAVKRGHPRLDVFRVQINDVTIRLRMLLNNEMDAAWLTEPQATQARLKEARTLDDSRQMHLQLGVVAFRQDIFNNAQRQQQARAFIKVYNMMCDSINKNGVGHYAAVIKKYMKIDDKTIQALPKLVYPHAGAPRLQDVEAARKWLQ